MRGWAAEVTEAYRAYLLADHDMSVAVTANVYNRIKAGAPGDYEADATFGNACVEYRWSPCASREARANDTSVLRTHMLSTGT